MITSTVDSEAFLRQDPRAPDRDVRVRSRPLAPVAAILIGLLVLGSALEGTAQACSIAVSSIWSRTVWPNSGPVPTSASVFVGYGALGPWPAGTPALGEDVVLLDGEVPVETRKDVQSNAVFLHPVAALLPNHTYQVADRRLVPCYWDQCTLFDAPRPVATFTTADAADNAPPTFSGIGSISVGEHQTCPDSCGPCDKFGVTLSWPAAVDDATANDVRYRIYRVDGASLSFVAGPVAGTQLGGAVRCSGFPQGGLEFLPGRYVVRAVDTSGNEDSNAAEVALGDVCANGGAMDAGTNADSGLHSESSRTGANGGCVVTGGSFTPPAALAMALLLMAATVAASRRRRRAGVRRNRAARRPPA